MTEENKSNNTIEISRDELQALLQGQKDMAAKLATLETELGISGGGIKNKAHTKNRKAHVRVVDGKVVTGFKNRGTEARPQFVYERQDPDDKTQRVNFVDLILEDGSTLSVKHMEFLEQSERVECEIVKIDREQFYMDGGEVRKKQVEQYHTIETDEVVPLSVSWEVAHYHVVLPETYGRREVVLDITMLNS